MTRLPRLLLVAVLAALALTVSAAPAAAKTPCWSKVINDWYDNGRIDSEYPIACYQQALKHLPPDVTEYADAVDVINRAMSAEIAKQSKISKTDKNGTNGKHGKKGRKSIGPVGKNGRSGGPPSASNGGSNPNPHDSLFAKAFDRLGPGNANSIPVPLIVLGSLALLLLAAGAAGMVARKLQERRPQPATVPQRANDGPAL